MPETLDMHREKLLGRQWKACFSYDYESDYKAFNNQQERNLFLDALLRFYRFHHQPLGDLKSLEILRTVFS
jgi:hypothetical protein